MTGQRSSMSPISTQHDLKQTIKLQMMEVEHTDLPPIYKKHKNGPMIHPTLHLNFHKSVPILEKKLIHLRKLFSFNMQKESQAYL